MPAVNNNGYIVEFKDGNATDSFNFKAKIPDQTDNNGRIDDAQVSLINCEINLVLAWSANCVIIYNNVTNQNHTFDITETKLYVPVVTLSTQDNTKLLPQLKSGFKRTINLSKYLSKPELLKQTWIHSVETSFHGFNKLFVLSFENDAERTSNKRYYLPNAEIRDYNVVIDGKKLFW